MSIIRSDRAELIIVHRRPGGLVRVSAPRQRATLDLTTVEARHLANTLLEYAEQIETDPMELKRRLS